MRDSWSRRASRRWARVGSLSRESRRASSSSEEEAGAVMVGLGGVTRMAVGVG